MAADSSNALVGVYRARVREPRASTEAYGYWAFVLGLIVGSVGLVFVFGSQVNSSERGLGLALLGVGLVAVLLGNTLQLGLGAQSNYVAVAGAVVSLAAVGLFWTAYPVEWAFGSETVWHVVGLAALGIIMLAVAVVVVPLVGDRVPTGARSSTTAERTPAGPTGGTGDGDPAPSFAEPAAGTPLAAPGDSQSQFELFADGTGQHRWRLRHFSGDVLAVGDEGFASRQLAGQDVRHVKRDAHGAAVVDLAALGVDVESIDDATAAVPFLTAADSRATFELVEADGGHHRWRLRHDDGTVMAESGAEYASSTAVSDAVERVRATAPTADYVELDPAVIEVYLAGEGAWRWRLVDERGVVVAESGAAFDERRDCRAAATDLAALVEPDSDAEFEFYEDSTGEYRWWLRDAAGELIAEATASYDDSDAAVDAVERLTEYTRVADVLEVGEAAIELYRDADEAWRWQLRHRDGRVLADGTAGYDDRQTVSEAVTDVKKHVSNAGQADVSG